MLKPEVEKKYLLLIPPGNQKQVWPKRTIHGVPAKKLAELTVEDVDKLVAAGAVKGIFQLKESPANVEPPVTEASSKPKKRNTN
jgi:hypothetical protein